MNIHLYAILYVPVCACANELSHLPRTVTGCVARRDGVKFSKKLKADKKRFTLLLYNWLAPLRSMPKKKIKWTQTCACLRCIYSNIRWLSSVKIVSYFTFEFSFFLASKFPLFLFLSRLFVCSSQCFDILPSRCLWLPVKTMRENVNFAPSRRFCLLTSEAIFVSPQAFRFTLWYWKMTMYRFQWTVLRV